MALLRPGSSCRQRKQQNSPQVESSSNSVSFSALSWPPMHTHSKSISSKRVPNTAKEDLSEQ